MNFAITWDASDAVYAIINVLRNVSRNQTH